MRIERLFSILIYLLHQEKVTAKELASYFEVTQRTIYRDLESLQMSGVPIIAYPGKNGGYALIDSYSLSAFTFTDEEKELLLTGLAMQKDIIGNERTKVLEQKLHLLKQVEDSNKDPFIFQNYSIHQKEIMQQVKKRMKILTTTIEQRRQVQIDYVTIKGDRQKRIIYPAKILFTNGSWYLVAYCTLREAMRQFKLTRVTKIEILNKGIPDDFTYLDDMLQPSPTLKKENLNLRFSLKSLGKLYDYFLPEDLMISKDNVEVNFLIEKNLNMLSFIAMFSDEVEVISPAWLKKAYLEKLENTLNKYKT